MIPRDIDAEYDELMDELEDALEAGAAERGERIQVIRRKIDELLRLQVGCAVSPVQSGWLGSDAVN